MATGVGAVLTAARPCCSGWASLLRRNGTGAGVVVGTELACGRLGLRCRRGLFGSGCRSGSGSGSGSDSAASRPRLADDGKHRADLDRLVLLDPDLEQYAGRGEGISVSTLSVETSSRGSSASTRSPTCFSHRLTVPSVTLSPSAGS